MARNFVRTAMAFAAMASVVTMSTAATAQVRPGQSVVSAERAATSTNAFQTRAGADMKDSNNVSSTTWVVIFLALIPIGFGIHALTKKTAPTSP
jgi:hypothetical protein